MSSFFLILISVLSFIFYGVVGKDKGPLLAPAFVLSLGTVIVYFGRQLMDGAAALKRPEPGRTKRLPVSSLLWLLFLAWGAFSVPDALMTFEAKIRMVFFAVVIGSYLVWGQEAAAFKDNRIVVGWLIFIVMLLALYGMIVHFKSPTSILWTERYTNHYLGEGRLASTYICPNHFAHLMQMLLPFCLALLFIPQSGIYLKILAAYSFVAMLPPLFLTQSRAGWLGSIAAVGTVILLMALRRSKKLFVFLAVLIPVCSVLLLAGAWRFSETFQRRMQPVVSFLEGQAEEGLGSEARDFRPQTWMDTLDMIREKPLKGYGPAAYRYAYPEFRKRWGGQRMVTGHPHNEYLELAADFGLIGFVLFAAAWLYGSFWILVKSLRAEEARHALMGFAFLGAVAGTMVHSFFDFQMHVFPNAMIFALLAALAVGPLKRAAEKGEKDRQGRKAGGGIVPVLQSALLAAVFISTLAAGIPVLASAALSAAADRRAEDKRVEPQQAAAALYRGAVKASADNWRAYRGLGQVLHHERRHRLEPDEKVQLALEEQEWFRKALAHNPKDPESLSAYGRVCLFLGRFGIDAASEEAAALKLRGLDALREACRYRKFNDQYWSILGVELRKAGHYAESLDAFRHMETIKRTPMSRKNIQWLEKRLSSSTEEPTPDETPESVERPDFEGFEDAASPREQTLEQLFELMDD